jgi:hypothetical protein
LSRKLRGRSASSCAGVCWNESGRINLRICGRITTKVPDDSNILYRTGTFRLFGLRRKLEKSWPNSDRDGVNRTFQYRFSTGSHRKREFENCNELLKLHANFGSLRQIETIRSRKHWKNCFKFDRTFSIVYARNISLEIIYSSSEVYDFPINKTLHTDKLKQSDRSLRKSPPDWKETDTPLNPRQLFLVSLPIVSTF